MPQIQLRRFAGVIVLLFLVAFAPRAQARADRDGSSWIDRQYVRVMKLVRTFVPKSLGDMIAVPRP